MKKLYNILYAVTVVLFLTKPLHARGGASMNAEDSIMFLLLVIGALVVYAVRAVMKSRDK